jgi:flavin reductase ActVB
MAPATGDVPAAELVTDFREAMGRLAAGIVMVTSTIDGRPWGLTVSACFSISMSPPTIAVSLGKDTASAHSIEKSGLMGVSILGEHLIGAARFGSARGAPKFVEDFCAQDCDSRTPAIRSAIAHVDCRVVRSIEVADHIVFFGEVDQVIRPAQPDNPLVYHDRRFHRLSAGSDLQAAPAPDLWW